MNGAVNGGVPHRSGARAAARALAVLSLAAPPLRAQDVTFGGAVDPQTMTFPFTSYGFRPDNRYQQFYAGAGFAGPVWIDAIRFQNTRSVAAGSPGFITPGSYMVRLATTARGEAGLGTDFDANAPGPLTAFFDGGVAGATLRFVGAPFRFDPARGNLLLDVVVRAQAPGAVLGLDFSQAADDGTGRVLHAIPQPGAQSPVRVDTFGLVTAFETRPAVVPEPSTVALAAAGLGALALARRGRRVGA